MARFFLTTDDEAFGGVTAGWREAEMPEGADLAFGLVRLATARKRMGRPGNGPVRHAGRWAIGVGTYASFGGAVGEAALGEVVRAFDPDDPGAVRRLIFGHYTLVIGAAGRLFVLGDAVESYDTVYWQHPEDPSRFAVGTMVADVMRAAPGAAIPPLAAFKAAYNGERGIADETAASGVRALMGHQALVIDPEAPRMRVIETPRPPVLAAPQREAAVRDYAAECARVLSVLPSFGSIGLNMTGGIDSRLLAAIVFANGVKPTVLYGEGDSVMTNTQHQDKKLAKAIAAKKGWPFRVMDWRQPAPHDAQDRRRFRARYGLKQLYGGTVGVARAMEGGIEPYPCIQLGAYTPPFTNYKPWEIEGGRQSIAALADALPGNPDVLGTAEARAAYRDGLRRDVRALADAHGVDVDDDGTISKADYVRLLVHARRSKDAYNIVAFNQFGAYLAPFFTTDLYEAVTRLPAEMREGDWFQLALIQALDPSLLDLPIFSFIRPFTVDRGTLTMRREAAPRQTGLRGLKRGIEARLPLAVRRRLRTVRGALTRPEDRTWAYRAALRRTLAVEVPNPEISPDRFAEEDLRVVYRYVTLLEASREIEAERDAPT